jgi:DNA polymerase
VIAAELGVDCTRCKLGTLGRRQVVFGVGNPSARLMFVGEGPGADEDRQGEPFVGRAGQLLDRIIEAVGLRREDVYIANVVKCRPPGNRNPEPDEIETCIPYLKRQVAAVQPAVLVALGKFAAQTLAGVGTPISRMRGKWYEFEGIPLMPTFHPAYVLRNPQEGRPLVWEDMLKVVDVYNEGLPPGVAPAVPKTKGG